MEVLTPTAAESLKNAMSHWPSGVSIVTTRDDNGHPWGFTASSFVSLSLDPALVLVCLARTAACYDAFMGTDHWTINILAKEQQEVARAFARRSEDKFAGVEVSNAGPDPVIAGSIASLSCDSWSRVDGGDHVILVGQVRNVTPSNGQPAIYLGGRFIDV